MKSLHQIKSGQKIVLKTITSTIKPELIRLGICEGDTVKCIASIPDGPKVILKGLQEIAIGRDYSKEIEVECV